VRFDPAAHDSHVALDASGGIVLDCAHHH